MKVMPTIEGGLRIDIETPSDWLVLEFIPLDALGESGGKLPERLGALMDDDSEWDEMVIPELRMFFADQVSKVAQAVKDAQADVELGKEEASGTIFITNEAGEDWYGALNQARLGLESQFKFGPSEEIDGLEEFSEEKRGGYVRNRFYLALQGLLLDYVVE